MKNAFAASLTFQIETGEILNHKTTQAISCHTDPTSFSFWKTPLYTHETMMVEKANKFLLFLNHFELAEAPKGS